MKTLFKQLLPLTLFSMAQTSSDMEIVGDQAKALEISSTTSNISEEHRDGILTWSRQRSSLVSIEDEHLFI